MLLPIAVGMLIVQFLPDFAKKVQPWVGWLGNIALYALIGATLIGYFPNMIAIVGTGAILVGLVFVLVAFGIGYLTGAGKDHLQDVGGLGTAQRNTAAAMIIAVQNFSDYPDVLVMITLANTLGIVMLMFIAKAAEPRQQGGDRDSLKIHRTSSDSLEEIAPEEGMTGEAAENQSKRKRQRKGDGHEPTFTAENCLFDDPGYECGRSVAGGLDEGQGTGNRRR